MTSEGKEDEHCDDCSDEDSDQESENGSDRRDGLLASADSSGFSALHAAMSTPDFSQLLASTDSSGFSALHAAMSTPDSSQLLASTGSSGFSALHAAMSTTNRSDGHAAPEITPDDLYHQSEPPTEPRSSLGEEIEERTWRSGFDYAYEQSINWLGTHGDRVDKGAALFIASQLIILSSVFFLSGLVFMAGRTAGSAVAMYAFFANQSDG